MNRGKYIVLEGAEGVGKSTQLQELSRRLQAAGLPVRVLREPDSQSDLTARAIRQITQDPRYPMNTRAEVLLYNAARAQSLQVIKQSVEHGIICLVDRNYLTTLAIQYYGRGDVPDYQMINSIIDFAVAGVEPDLCIVLDAPVNVLKDRLKDRYNGERFDNLSDSFLERVRAGYLWEAKQRNLPVVFATDSSDVVADNIWKLVREVLQLRTDSQAAAAAPPASVKEIIEQKQLPPEPKAENKAEKASSEAYNSATTVLGDSQNQQSYFRVAIDNASSLLAQRLGHGGLAAHSGDVTNSNNYFIPEGLKANIKKQYTQTMDSIFQTYSSMMQELTEYVRTNSDAPKTEHDSSWEAATLAKAFSAAGKVLPVAAKTNIDTYFQPQEYENLVLDLMNDELPEAQAVGQDLIHKGRKEVPDFLKQIDLNRRPKTSKVKKLINGYLPETHAAVQAEEVTLVDFWPKNEMLLVPYMVYEQSNLALEQLQAAVNAWPYGQKLNLFKACIDERDFNRSPAYALEKASYSWDIVCDYATFCDLQRHRTAARPSVQQLTPRYGFDVPQLIEAAGLTEKFESCFELSLKLHSAMQAAGHGLEAQYAMLFGHKLRSQVTCNALEMLVLYELSEAQERPGYISLLLKMHEKLAEVHPVLSESINFADRQETSKFNNLSNRPDQQKLKQGK